MANFREVRVIPTQEELKNSAPPNLNVNIIDGKYENVETYLETQFNLLREDFNCNLREAIQEYIDGSRLFKNAYVYEKILIFQIELLERGVKVKLNLDMTSFKVIGSKRLLVGSIVCLSWNSFEDIVIATVTYSPQTSKKRIELGFFEVVIDPLNDFKFLELVREKPYILLTAIEPKNYFEAYRHSLRILQSLDERTFPMQNYIVEVETNEIRPPNYLNEVTTYDLSHLVITSKSMEANHMKRVNVLNVNEWPPCDDFQMDESQYVAFKEALTREFALIQGPPGTGKTHIGLQMVQTFLQNKSVWDAEDNNCILVCCYTNHALDQFLNGIVPFCNKVLRLGGRNTSDILKAFTIRDVKSRVRFSKQLTLKIAEKKTELMGFKLPFNLFLRKANDVRESVIPFSAANVIEETMNSEQVRSLLSYNDYFEGNTFSNKVKEWLMIEDEDKNWFECEMLKEDMMELEEAKLIKDLKELSLTDRWRLYRLWVKIYLDQFKSNGNIDWAQYLRVRRELKELRLEQDVFVARNAKVIGATTTCAAKKGALIRRLRPKIVIFEEAAEIFEAHIITALSEHTEHLILIGDHNQLRPSPNVYDISLKCHLNVSLFERMIRNNLCYSRLLVQHRMQPNISRLLVPLFYEKLEDYISVTKYESVKGITKSLFFINHNYPEMSKVGSTSWSNEHECSFIVSLCKHLVHQGYKQSQITILSMYSAQYFDLKDAFQAYDSLRSIKIATVDNFQGEENDIIICSFVRSNDEGEIGFLKTPNRVNVALSRAKMGFYAIGNFEKMAEVSKNLWKPLLEKLKENGNIGNALELKCQNHKQTTCLVSQAKDFNQFPEGFCVKPCNNKFRCGHICKEWCHTSANKHSSITCSGVCLKEICDNGHRCQQRCHCPEVCSPCTIYMKKSRICGHSIDVYCSVDANSVPCIELCGKWISCGHRCRQHCGKKCNSLLCRELIEVESLCPHSVISVPCNEKNEPKEKLLNYCKKECGQILKCGHKCIGTCIECSQGRFHQRCNEKCGRTLICGHICKHPCVENCQPCTLNCENSCQHDVKCDHECGGPCFPCLAWCLWQCEHLKCTKLCSEPCNRTFCDKKCNKKLECGHDCIGICGETCPTLCRICNKEEVEEIFFGNENEHDRRFVQLTDCGHIFEFEGLTKYMRESDGEIRLKPCPKCQKIIRISSIYNREIQVALANIEKVKRLTSATASFTECLRIVHEVKKVIDKIYSILNRQVVSHIITDKVKQILNQQNFAISNSTIFFIKPELLKIQTIVTTLEVVIDFFDMQYESDEIVSKFYQRLREILKFISTNFDNNEQQRSDLNREVDLVYHIGKCMLLYFNSSITYDEEFNEKFLGCFDTFCKPGVLKDEELIELKNKLNEAFKHRTGIGIPIKDMKMVVDSMNFRQKGHWFKCPNNHVYCITECGGATQIGQCPECKEVIGGNSHRLLESNSIAIGIDGATMSAFEYDMNA